MDEQREVEIPYSWLDTSAMQVGFRLPNVQWRLYLLSEDKLHALEQGSNSPSLGLLGLFGGIAFSTLTTIKTVELTAYLTAWFVGALVASTGLTVILAIQAFREWRSMKRLIAGVREQHTP